MRTIDLARIEIEGAWHGAPHRRFVGRALHAWLLDFFASLDPVATGALHNMPGQKPFSIALIEGVPSRLVVTGYGPCVEPVLRLAGRFPGHLRLDCQDWVATSSPVLRTASWPSLSAARDDRTRLAFLTPTVFHIRGQAVPFPLADVLFGGLLQRWERWSPMPLGAAAAETIAQSAVLTRFRGETAPVQLRGHVPGFVGVADYALHGAPAPEEHLLPSLAAFAEFAGAGQKVGMGLGCVRSLPVAEAIDRRRPEATPAERVHA